MLSLLVLKTLSHASAVHERHGVQVDLVHVIVHSIFSLAVHLIETLYLLAALVVVILGVVLLVHFVRLAAKSVLLLHVILLVVARRLMSALARVA